LSRRRAAVENSRRQLEDDTRRLAELQERITAGETATRRAEQERVRLEAEVRVRSQKEQERLKETRERIAAAHKEIGALRYQADEEERQLEDLRSLVDTAEKASKKRIKLNKTLAAEVDVVNRNGNSPN
jgi:dTMP kinase